ERARRYAVAAILGMENQRSSGQRDCGHEATPADAAISHALRLRRIVLVWIKDRDGRYCWVNRAFLINYAMDRLQSETPADSEDVVGKTDYDLSPTFLADQYRLDDEQVLTGKRIVNRIELVGQPEGLTVWNVTNKVPLTNTDGTIIGTAGITRRLDTS